MTRPIPGLAADDPGDGPCLKPVPCPCPQPCAWVVAQMLGLLPPLPDGSARAFRAPGEPLPAKPPIMPRIWPENKPPIRRKPIKH